MNLLIHGLMGNEKFFFIFSHTKNLIINLLVKKIIETENISDEFINIFNDLNEEFCIRLLKFEQNYPNNIEKFLK